MSDARTAIFNMRITPEEREAWKQAALQSGLTMTGWARAMLNANLGSVLNGSDEGGGPQAPLTSGDASVTKPSDPLSIGSVLTEGEMEPDAGRRNRVTHESVSSSVSTELDHAVQVIKDTGGAKAFLDRMKDSQGERSFAPDPKPAGRKKKR